MDRAYSSSFVDSWVGAWSTPEVDRISNFADDARSTPPIAARLLPDTGGILEGKDALRFDRNLGLDRIADLHITGREIFTGVDCVVIRHKNQTGAQVGGALPGEVVARGGATYAENDAIAASNVRSKGA